jgi:hypothetical protein
MWLLVLVPWACGAPPLEPSAARPGDRVGTYDGRAVAVAYANGPLFAARMRELREAHNAAEDRQDEAEMAALEARAVAQQQRFHAQAFDGADVDDILEVVAPQLAGLCASAGVVRLEKVNLARPDGVVTVDVTDRLVDLFEPSDKGRRWIRDLRARPLPR